MGGKAKYQMVTAQKAADAQRKRERRAAQRVAIANPIPAHPYRTSTCTSTPTDTTLVVANPYTTGL